MSDLWRWVFELERDLHKKGQTRLAEIVDALPSAVCDNDHARADALAVEGVALARGLEHPWLEVFLRHWHLQSRVLHRMEGESALGECVALVDFAHGPETSKCPQAICAVQDLSACYGYVDDRGYVDERLNVLDETLARIDARWPCFSCISSEKATALRVKHGGEASLVFLKEQIEAMTLAGTKNAAHDVGGEWREALIDLGRLDEVLAFLDEGERIGRKDASKVMNRRIDRARVLARLGRFEEARAALPEVSEVEPTPSFYRSYADALALLCRGGAIPNGHVVGRVLTQFVRRLAKQGVLRTGLEMAELAGDLAIERGATITARRALEEMRKFAARLQRPLDALDRIQRLARAIDEAEARLPIDLPATDEEVLEAFNAEDDPERADRMLTAALARSPANAELTRARARVLRALGCEDEASDLFVALYDRRPGDGDLAFEVGQALRASGDAARLEAFLSRFEADAPDDATRANAWWIRALDRLDAGDVDAAIPLFERVMKAWPDNVSARMGRARCARLQQDFATWLACLDEALALGADPARIDWDRMIAATMVGAWDKVRESAQRRGMTLEGEGEIDDPRGVCRLRFDDGAEIFAARTGPVTARVLQMGVPRHEQRFEEVWVFEATPLNDPPASEDEDHTWVYPVVARLKPSGRRVYFLDGVHPGAEVVATIKREAEALGVVLRVLSGDGYRVGERLGIYAGMAAPIELDPKVLSDRLRAVTEGLELTWIALADAAEDAELAAKQREMAAELEL
jgi:tetratricopeptide (TPR) repeat protein